VPDEISLAGFDDLFVAQYSEPPLTTVRQPRRQMGRLAMETLLKLIEGGSVEELIRVPGELVIRRSTAPPRPEANR